MVAGGRSGPAGGSGRSYTSFQACLLTGEQGLADPAAAPVWAGMQQASLATDAKVSYLAVRGPQTADNALVFLNALMLRHCGLVLAAGRPERDAVVAQAGKYPSVRFAVVGGTSTAPNVMVLSGGDAAVRDGTARQMSHAAGG
ncbi:MAG: hypothetical protein J2P15_18210 [Micromonosporaceae bacterium]|nr:hypothetical protein [Micromonosporaceae bacterium]